MSLKPTPITDEINEYLIENFSADDEFLINLKKEARNAGIPEIHISPVQAAFMQFMLKTIGAKRVLEIGTLAGYSAITMARALPEDGLLTAVEVNKNFAEFAKKKSYEAGLKDKIEIYNNHAVIFLKEYNPEIKFDFVFMDAQKTEYEDYFKLVENRVRPGGIIAADNALAFGDIVSEEPDRDSEEVRAVRRFNEYVKNHEDFETTLVTAGDGLLMALKKQ